MAKKDVEPLTPRESEIMEILWRMGEASAEDVRAGMNGNPHDSTVRTLLRVLIGKGHVKREDGAGGIVYKPTLPKAKAQKRAIRDLLDRFFAGSAQELVLRLIDEKDLTPKQMEEIKRRAKK